MEIGNKLFKKIIFFINFIGTPNWYQGIDKPTFYEWIYKWRIGFKTTKELWSIFNENAC